jgi:hypothetical protein
MHSIAPFLSAPPAREVCLGQEPRLAARVIATSAKPSSIIARAAPQRSNLHRMHVSAVRVAVVAIGWTVLGISCAELFSAFHGY